MKIKSCIICLAALAFLLCGCQRKKAPDVSAPKVTGSFDFTILKAGQADAIVLRTENHSFIIDCGEKDDGDKIVEYLNENGISKLDCIFVTHFDKDHVGGFCKVAENFAVDNIFVPNYEGHNEAYKKYLASIEENELNAISLTENVSFVFDDVLIEAFVPQKTSYAEGDNDFSLAISITHGENTFLFAGDAEKERIDELVSEMSHEYDFLKVPHHGRYNENTEKFFEAVKPKYSAICDSKKNPASNNTIKALESVGSEIYCTRDGSVSVSSDGEKITVVQ